MDWLPVFLLAFAVSLDGFGVGFTYGLRKMKIPLRSIMTIAVCSAMVLLAAMGIGTIIETRISAHVAERLGGIVLILIGVWILYQLFRSSHSKDKKDDHLIANFEIKSLGIVIQILEKPLAADFDESGTITGIEALVLGLALSLDAFGAGVGAALLGYPPLATAVFVAFMSSVFVLTGMKCGRMFSKMTWIEKLSFFPGCLLILLGLFKF